jgi:2-polyprenyl-3-methyl-5-hydroxy-6-metoxy-1,4-benzoquinol methylase
MTITDRIRIPETMDDPGLDPMRHFAALRALARINALSGTWRALSAPIFSFARQTGRKKLRILDLATGGGDVPISLWRYAQQRGLELDILAVDVSPRAIEFARERADACGAAVEFSEVDVLAGELPTGFDVVTCCLFLHHLDESDVVSLLRSMARASDHLVLASDLARSRVGLMLAYFGTWVLTSSEVARVDGARSARAAFSLAEIRTLAAHAGLNDATVRRRWPCRYLLSWNR